MVLSTLCGFDAPPFTRSFNDVIIVQTAVAVIAHLGGKKFSAPADALTIAASRAIMDAIRLFVIALLLFVFIVERNGDWQFCLNED
jgi:hypothetical protein